MGSSTISTTSSQLHRMFLQQVKQSCWKFFDFYAQWLLTKLDLHVAVLGWQNTCESADDITATLAALNTEIDVSVLYRGLDPKNRYCLVSVVWFFNKP